MNVTPFGAKSPSDTVVGVAADADGKLKTKKAWENDLITIFDTAAQGQGLPVSTSTIWTEQIDVSDAGAISLRIRQSTDTSYVVEFGTDTSKTSYALRELESETNSIRINIPASSNTKYYIVTPDDVPILAWIRKIRLAITPAEVPTTGNLAIWVVAKR